MTPSEVSALLTYVIGLDIRMQCTPDVFRVRVAAWHDVLAAVDLGAAREAVKRHYANPDAQPITPGAILTRWTALPENRAQRELPGPGTPMPAELKAQMAQLFRRPA